MKALALAIDFDRALDTRTPDQYMRITVVDSLADISQVRTARRNIRNFVENDPVLSTHDVQFYALLDKEATAWWMQRKGQNLYVPPTPDIITG